MEVLTSTPTAARRPEQPLRFTVDGSDRLEAHLAHTCARVAEGVRAIIPGQSLDAILLGGGYGRGEGGVCATLEGDRPYNDLEFYVMVRGNVLLAERRYGRRLHDLEHRLSPEAGVELEFKLLSFAKLRRSAPCMFYYDLVSGHRWIAGSESQLTGCEHHRDPAQIPLHEATRLLMNRCSGLLFSAERLNRAQFGSAESDFVARNLAKAGLAFGDVVLAAHGQYDWSCRRRGERLHALAAKLAYPWIGTVVHHHESGVGFKLHPVLSGESREELFQRHRELANVGLTLWLWLENRRLATRFDSAASYSCSRADLCPETAAWKNAVLNLRTFGLKKALGRRLTRYPREWLLRSLPLLLWGTNSVEERGRIERWLGAQAPDLPGLVDGYHHLWSRFN